MSFRQQNEHQEGEGEQQRLQGKNANKRDDATEQEIVGDTQDLPMLQPAEADFESSEDEALVILNEPL